MSTSGLAKALLAASLAGWNEKGNVTSKSLCSNGHLLPTFFLLGAQKGGSTSLWFSLQAQGTNFVGPTPLPGDPDYFAKEAHFFDNQERVQNGIELYKRYYPKCPTADSPLMVAADGTPNYLTHKMSPRWAKSTLPKEAHARLVFAAVLRDPTERALSWVKHVKRKQTETHEGEGIYDDGNIGTHVQWGFAHCFGDNIFDNAMNSSDCQSFRYTLDSGMYRDGLTRWVVAFPESVFILSSLNEYLLDAAHVVNTIANAAGFTCKKLGCAGTKAVHSNSQNRAQKKRNDGRGTSEAFARRLLSPSQRGLL